MPHESVVNKEVVYKSFVGGVSPGLPFFTCFGLCQGQERLYSQTTLSVLTSVGTITTYIQIFRLYSFPGTRILVDILP